MGEQNIHVSLSEQLNGFFQQKERKPFFAAIYKKPNSTKHWQKVEIVLLLRNHF